jgi:signal transduction histidine kinase/CheY-like chemotaxis protein/ligand-binding sensor domain-containing protein/AraC-like DNA-binding protein
MDNLSKWVFLFVFAVSVVCLPAYGHANAQWHVKQITNEDDLSNSAVNTIYQDASGYMWFGTWDGLNQYDGKSIISHYPALFDENKISNNIIWQILEDSLNGLWVVTERGINRYDYERNVFESWFDKSSSISTREGSLQASLGPHGNVWVSVYGQGLFRFSDSIADFVPVAIQGLAHEQQQLITNIYGFNGLIYLLHENFHVSILQPNGNLIDEFKIDFCNPNEEFRANPSWFFHIEGQPYLALPSTNGGLWVINLNDQSHKLFRDENFVSVVTALHPLQEEGLLLLGMDDGNILTLNMAGNNTFEVFLVGPDMPANKRVKIWSMLKTDNLLWVGTDGEGVYRVDMQPKQFKNIGFGSQEERKINHKIVREVFEDKSGNLWIGTRGNGLNMIPADGSSTRIYNTSNGLSNDAVLSIAMDHNNHLWVGMDVQGIDIMNLKTGKISHFPDDLKGADGLSIGPVYAICVDAYGMVWLGTSGSGIFGIQYSLSGNQYQLEKLVHLPGRGGADDLRGNIVFSIVEEKPNILWIGTRQSGLHRYNSLTREMQFYGQATANTPGLNNPDVLSLLVGRDRTLWVGTSGGLNSIDLSRPDRPVDFFTLTEGLPNHTIHAILEDNQGDIWISTNKGLSRYLRKEARFVNYNSGDGLLSNEFTDGAAFHNATVDRLYFGGINGVDWFYPSQIDISNDNPEVLLTAFSLFDKKIEPGDENNILKSHINYTDKIILNHNQNFFGVEFTVLNYHNPVRNNFAYKLENFNIDWVYTGSQRLGNFTNVPYGKYRLLIRATNEDGFWSDNVKTINITIKPPFYLTYMAFVAYFLLFALLVYLLYKYQTNRIRKKQAAVLEQLRQQKEKELNHYKFEFFTNLAHEFRTPLTLIFASAATLIGKITEHQNDYPLYRNVYNNARRMQHMIEELLAFQKLDTGNEALSLKVVDVVEFVSRIVDVFIHYANEKELELNFEPEENELFMAIDNDKMERILLNLLSNAIKYTSPGGSITVVFRTTQTHAHFLVQDTGTGIPKEILPRIFDRYFHYNPLEADQVNQPKSSGIGLAYTHSLVQLHHGEIEVDSELGLGSVFKVAIPLKIDSKKRDSSFRLSLGPVRERLLESIVEDYFLQQDAGNESSSLAGSKVSNYRILIVEDDLQLLQLLQALISENHEVATAQNGQEALNLLREERIDLVVSDVMMPVMDGLTLCKAVKTDVVTSHIPVVLLTARSDNEHLIEGLETGADSYITKPFHPKHLQLSIERLLIARERLTSVFERKIGNQLEDDVQHLSERDRKLLDKAFEFIGEHYFKDGLNADQLADHLALSKAQLYRKIKAITGLTPHGLIKKYRLSKAREMIKDGKYNISDIVFMTGFNNRAYFYRSYREQFGETPGEMNKSSGTKQAEL